MSHCRRSSYSAREAADMGAAVPPFANQICTTPYSTKDRGTRCNARQAKDTFKAEDNVFMQLRHYYARCNLAYQGESMNQQYRLTEILLCWPVRNCA